MPARFRLAPADVIAFRGLAIGVLALALVSILFRPLFPVDETRYLTVAWEMWRDGHWLIPHLNGALYDHKPPLLFWLIHAGWLAFGVNEWTPRLIGPLAAIVVLVNLVRLSARLWPAHRATGFTAAWILLGSWYVAFFLTGVMFDLVLLAFITWSWLRLHQAVQRGRFVDWLLAGVALGLGLLTKGPVAFVYTVPLLLAANWWRESDGRGATVPGACWYFLAAISVPVAWLLCAQGAHTSEYLHRILVDQTALRVTGSLGHPRPWWWYLPLLPLLFTPWFLWAPFWRALTRFRGRLSEPGMRFALVAAAIPLLLLSVINGKQVHYLLPVLVALSLVAARCLADLPAGRWISGMVAPAAAMSPLILLAIIAARNVLPLNTESWPTYLAWDSYAGLALLGLISGWLVIKPATSPVRAVPTIAMASLACTVIVMTVLYPRLTQSYGLGPMAREASRAEREGRPVAFVGRYQGELGFQARLTRPIIVLKPAEVAAWTNSNPGGVVIANPAKLATKPGTPLAIQPYLRGRLAAYPASAFLAATTLEHDTGTAQPAANRPGASTALPAARAP